MYKCTVIKNLHTMIDARLFGVRPWLPDREDCDAIRKKLDDMGLQERVPGDMLTTRSTALGRQLQLDLVMVFLGLWDEWEVPSILERYGLIDKVDELHTYDRLETSTNPESVLRPLVRKAFLDHYNPSGLLV